MTFNSSQAPSSIAMVSNKEASSGLGMPAFSNNVMDENLIFSLVYRCWHLSLQMILTVFDW